MDRRFPSPGHHLTSQSSHDPIPTEAYHARTATNPTSERTPPCCSSRLPHQEADPHSSRMEHHSTNLQTSRPSLLRRSRTTLPRTTYLGSRHRLKVQGP